MTTDVEQRIRAALAQLVEAEPVTTPPATVVVQRPARPARRTLPALVVAAAVAAVLVLVPLLVPAVGGRMDPATGSVRLPRQFAPFSFLTGDLADAPLDRAMAVYAQRYGGGFWGPARVDGNDPDWQLVVLDASGERYRRTHAIDPVSYRLGMFPGGTPFNGILLAPDGRHVAFDSGSISLPDLRVLDIGTGAFSVPLTGSSFTPLAWSPDGTHLVVSVWKPFKLTYGVLDVTDGTFVPHSDLAPTQAAFSPDGTQLALQVGSDVVVVDNQGQPLRRFTLPPDQALSGHAAWSPDGTVLAITEAKRPPDEQSASLVFVGAADGKPIGNPIPTGLQTSVQGWRDSETVVTWDAERLATLSIHSGQSSTLAETGADVSYLQVASGLITQATTVDAVTVDRGPWPHWVRYTAAILGGFVVIVAVGLGRIVVRGRRHGRASQSKSSPIR
jgi:hypothetical protein